ncbi:uncharacterized protein LOC120640442 isoform X23 [Panicum virgatum]|uniref:uncharacterized protein LOC120640442 isoform X23 n=1 Tax=Panicum virgatum TaxID=38727 RepID=UPI0019D61AB8|nr:uncharacterized protein LOC120640442 isoform X23 [Panicum virgatum]
MGRVSFTASAPVLFAPLLSALVLLLFRPAVFRPALPAFRSSCSHQVVCRCDTFSVTASCSSLSVTEPSENEPEEPTESVEPEPGIPFVVEPEVNQGESEVVFGYFYPADPNVGEE